MSETTLAKFAGTRRANYSTLPTVDVEILPDARICETCAQPVAWDKSAHTFGGWVHADGSTEHYVAPRTRCAYCHAQDGVTYRQHAWYDAIECDRCGGVTGYAIGD